MSLNGCCLAYHTMTDESRFFPVDKSHSRANLTQNVTMKIVGSLADGLYILMHVIYSAFRGLGIGHFALDISCYPC